MRRAARSFFGAVLLCAGLIHSSPSRAQDAAGRVDAARYDVDATVDCDEGQVRASVRIVAHVDESADTLRLWLYADRLATSPSAMDEQSARWIFPDEVSLGGIDLRGVRVDDRAARTRLVRHPNGEPLGRDASGAWVEVALPEGHGREITLRAEMSLRLPDRFGRLGRAHGACSMLAPWYPLVVDADGAFDVEATHHVRIASADGALLLSDVVGARSLEVDRRGAYVPAMAADDLHVEVRRRDDVEVRFVSFERAYSVPPSTSPGVDGLRDLVRIPTPDLVADVAEDAALTLLQLHVAPPRDPLTVVVMPSRTELAATAPGVVLVSDRLYEIFPAEVTRGFHDRALRRALFAHLLDSASRAVDAPTDRGWSLELRAVLFADLDEERRSGRAQSAEELLEIASFHPTVDQLLYAPQIPFAEIYFGAVDEPDRFRDDPARARRPEARGRRMLESARDALGAERFLAFAEDVVEGRVSVREAVALRDEGIAHRVDRWIDAPLLEVNYRLGEIVSERDGERWRTRVEIFREGAARSEPVEVEVIDEDGRREVGIWDGEDDHGFVEVLTPARVDDVRIDPRARLPQSASLTEGHARADDATSAPWKPPILQSFAFDASLGEGRFGGVLEFGVRRRYDLEHGLVIRLFHDADSSGAVFRFVHGVGPKRHNNARIGALSAGLELSRLHSGIIEGEEGAYSVGLSASAGVDTRRFLIDPRRGAYLAASARVAGTRRDGGGFGVTAAAAIRSSLLVPIGLRQVLLLIAGAGWSFGDGLAAERQSLGGSLTLRGFQLGELLGDGRAYAIAEHRYTLVPDLAWNILHIAWVRELQIAAFAGAGLLFGAEGGDDLRAEAEIGAGLRVHFEYGGVQPAVFSVDVARPMTRETDAVLRDGEVVRRRAPIAVLVSFDQFY